MSKKCDLTGIKPMYGNNVSHSNKKTRRRFEPNLQNVTLKSEVLNTTLKLKITTSTLRTINKYGNIDNFLINYRHAKLTDEAIKIKNKIKKSLIKTGSFDAIKLKTRAFKKQ